VYQAKLQKIFQKELLFDTKEITSQDVTVNL
jgi:hypothetical protein